MPLELSAVVPSLKDYIAQHSGLFPDALEKIIVFGSFAKGTARVGSDVDIALVSAINWEIADKGIVRDALEDFAPDMHLSLFYTTIERLKADSPNDANYWICKEGVVLWERKS